MADYESMVEGLNAENYWIIMPRGVEWEYMMQKIRNENFKDASEASQDVVLAYDEAGNTIFFLRKTKLPAEKLATYVGSTPEKLAATRVLKLSVTAKKDAEPLPQATVSGWGTA